MQLPHRSGTDQNTLSSRVRAPSTGHDAPPHSSLLIAQWACILNCHREERPHLQTGRKSKGAVQKERAPGLAPRAFSRVSSLSHSPWRTLPRRGPHAEAPEAAGRRSGSGRSGFSSGRFCFLPSSGPSAAQKIKTPMKALRGQELPRGQGPEILTFLPWRFSLHPSPV